MQESNEKTLQLAKEVGQVIRGLRKSYSNATLNLLANSYGIGRGTLSDLENGKFNCKLVTIWKISEALGLKCSDVIKIAEEQLGENFKLIEE